MIRRRVGPCVMGVLLTLGAMSYSAATETGPITVCSLDPALVEATKRAVIIFQGKVTEDTIFPPMPPGYTMSATRDILHELTHMAADRFDHLPGTGHIMALHHDATQRVYSAADLAYRKDAQEIRYTDDIERCAVSIQRGIMPPPWVHPADCPAYAAACWHRPTQTITLNIDYTNQYYLPTSAPTVAER